jgi:hypothetical protein
MLTIDERKIADPGTGAPPADGNPSFRRILVCCTPQPPVSGGEQAGTAQLPA